jgi:FMN phosphatase YigB (HAD superfamily)
MYIFVFDLDDTLLPSNSYSSYNDIKIDKEIHNIFTNIYNTKSPIYIYTNGTLNHALKSLDNMDIIHLVTGIFARDNIPYMKPSIDSFEFVNNKIKSRFPKSNIIFFDDMIDNCRVASLFNWYSILINPNNDEYLYGHDLHYDNIYDAFS